MNTRDVIELAFLERYLLAMNKRPKSNHPKTEGGAFSVKSRDATSGRYLTVSSANRLSGGYVAERSGTSVSEGSAPLERKSRTTTNPRSADPARTNAALREGGIDYQVEPGQDFDAKAFTKAALKRWQKVAARLAE
ncbi:hypothetical protein [Ancylobacter sp. SL191]|uniref:hypothetical protein n=1 Tax=Ancylobacter sp. SL191 TaxID=2995166 RepID=UPI00227028F9|nr:hypothetical protein [Ancylobacter sp. SL191]WAC27447.1 hypothetical protein OU996_21025 [Ancylobacter sp. SL191]